MVVPVKQRESIIRDSRRTPKNDLQTSPPSRKRLNCLRLLISNERESFWKSWMQSNLKKAKSIFEIGGGGIVLDSDGIDMRL
jgi:hypothetical protein